MKKWFKTLQAFGAYRRGDVICPEGLYRESLQNRGMITRQPVYIGPRKPRAEDCESWLKATSAPDVTPDPEPVRTASAAVLPETENSTISEFTPRRRRGRPRKKAARDE